MKISITDFELDDLDTEWRVDMRALLRQAVEDEVRKVARQVARERFEEANAEVVEAMRRWLSDTSDEELAKL